MDEIAQEAAQAAGELSEAASRRLDDLFWQFAPFSGAGRNSKSSQFDRIAQTVDAFADIDALVPIESHKPGGAYLKRIIRKLTFWYMDYLAYQVVSFAKAASAALMALNDRLGLLERGSDGYPSRTGGSQRQNWSAMAQVDKTSGPARQWLVQLALQQLNSVNGRVLHFDCDQGYLVDALINSHTDAYGVGQNEKSVNVGVRNGLDLRCEGIIEHLSSLRSGTLKGAVLNDCLEALFLNDRYLLLDLLAKKLSPNAKLLLCSVHPDAWGKDDYIIAADLAPAKPFDPKTWSYLLEKYGFEDISVHDEGVYNGTDNSHITRNLYCITASVPN